MKSYHYILYYGGTGTGKTYFVRQYLKLYQNLDGEASAKPFHGCLVTQQEQKEIIIVCENEREWINPKTGNRYTEFNMCDINMITAKNIPNF